MTVQLRYPVILFLFAFAFPTAGLAQSATEHAYLQGNWMLTKGRIFANNIFSAGHMNSHPQYISFTGDSLIIRPGIFYQIFDRHREDYTPATEQRFSFVYYGYSTRYTLDTDSIRILDPPHKKWIAFQLNRTDSQTLQLVSKKDTVLLKKCADNIFQNPFKTEVKSISAQVHNEVHLVLYNVTLYPGDSMVFNQYDIQTFQWIKRKIKLDNGYFNHVVSGFALVDLKQIKPTPKSEDRGHNSIEVTIRFKNRKKLVTQLYTIPYPRDLEIAIIPIIYAHQKHLYKDPPIVE